MRKSNSLWRKPFTEVSWSCRGCYKDKEINPELNLLISFHDYCSQKEETIKTNACISSFPQNEHWSDSVWKVCNISSAIILKYINRDLCIVEQRVLFLPQDKSSEFWHQPPFTTMWLVEIISSSWFFVSFAKWTLLPHRIDGLLRSCMLKAKTVIYL